MQTMLGLNGQLPDAVSGLADTTDGFIQVMKEEDLEWK